MHGIGSIRVRRQSHGAKRDWNTVKTVLAEGAESEQANGITAAAKVNVKDAARDTLEKTVRQDYTERGKRPDTEKR